jgi:hypothetical protein
MAELLLSAEGPPLSSEELLFSTAELLLGVVEGPVPLSSSAQAARRRASANARAARTRGFVLLFMRQFSFGDRVNFPKNSKIFSRNRGQSPSYKGSLKFF